jgi:hypothetical protein
MDALDQSDELIRRGGELRARSMMMRAVADEQMERSRQLIAAAREARRAVRYAHGWVPAGHMGRDSG